MAQRSAQPAGSDKRPVPADSTSASPAERNERRRTYSLRTRLGLAFVASLSAIFVAEITVRILGIAPDIRPIMASDVSSPYKYSTNPILGYEHKANYRNENPDHVISFGSTNSHGQRDIDRQIEKPPGVRRILLLGDSVVESLEVVELDDLMNRQLEMLYLDGKTEVLNFGVNGYCTLAEVELLRTKGLKFDPDLVVLVFVANDFNNFNAAAGGTVAGIEQLNQATNAAPSSAARKFLLNYSHLCRMASARRGHFDALAQNHEALGDNNVVQGLKLLRKLADEHGFGVIIAIWPTFLENEIIDTYQIPGTNDVLIERLARSYGFPTVRLSERFNEHWKSLDGVSSPQKYYTIDDSMHVNETGSRATAQVLKTVVDDADELTQEFLAKATDHVTDGDVIAAARQLGAQSGTYNIVSAVIDLGIAQQTEGRHNEAIHFYEIALEIDPNSARAHACLGSLYVETGQPIKAQYHFKKATH
jgi:tetratricopeptide (TPR) repeat protein